MREAPEEPLVPAEDPLATVEARKTEPTGANERAMAAAVGDAGWALPLLGAVLLVSPLVRISTSWDSVVGAPGPIVYVFGVWLFLILLAARLAHRAERAAADEQSAAQTDEHARREPDEESASWR